MLLAQDVLHAYTMISISIMVVFTSLKQRDEQTITREGHVSGETSKQIFVFSLTLTSFG